MKTNKQGIVVLIFAFGQADGVVDSPASLQRVAINECISEVGCQS
jgi:hypothetical protein